MKIVLLIIMFPIIIFCQDSLTVSDRFILDGKSLINTTAHTFSNPIRWEKDDFKTLAYVASIGGLFYLFDNQINSRLKADRKNSLESLRALGDNFGKPITGTATTMALFTYGIFSGNKWSRETGVLLGSTLAVSGFIQTLSKTVFGRARPSKKKGKHAFDPFPKKTSYHSFPSGHTTVALSISLVLAHQIESDLVKYPLYTLAGITGWSRLYENKHWASDVFLGAALSYFAFRANLSYMEKQQKNKSTNQVLILPKPNGIQISLSL